MMFLFLQCWYWYVNTTTMIHFTAFIQNKNLPIFFTFSSSRDPLKHLWLLLVSLGWFSFVALFRWKLFSFVLVFFYCLPLKMSEWSFLFFQFCVQQMHSYQPQTACWMNIFWVEAFKELFMRAGWCIGFLIHNSYGEATAWVVTEIGQLSFSNWWLTGLSPGKLHFFQSVNPSLCSHRSNHTGPFSHPERRVKRLKLKRVRTHSVQPFATLQKWWTS